MKLKKSTSMFAAAVAGFAVLGTLVHSTYLLHILIIALMWCVVVAAWDLLIGYAGILNFAQLVFFAIGGYASQILSMKTGLALLPSLIAGALAAGASGLLVGLPCLRLRGEYVALFTFAVHLAFPTVLEHGRAFGTGGSGGLIAGEPLVIANHAFVTADKSGWYFLMLAVAALATWLIYFVLLKGKWGRAFVVLRDAEMFAKSLGVHDFAYRLLAFMLSAALTGFVGGLYTSYVGVITPNVLGNEFFLMVMVMLCIGGMGRFPGALVGAFAITLGNEGLREFGQYRLIILGILVIATLLFLPEGLAGLLWRRRRPAA